MRYEEKCFNNKLRYLEAGSGNAILFLHGAGVEAFTYEKFLESLAKEYRVIAPDLPCFGKSYCSKNISEYIGILEDFLDFLNVKEITIVGHSFGGVMGLELASRRNIQFLILVDSAGIAQEFTAKFLYKFFIEKTIRDIFLYNDFGSIFKKVKDFFVHGFKRLFKLKRVIGMVHHFVANDFLGFDKISAKTFILWGEKDEIFPEDDGKKMRDAITGSELKSVRGNHDWPLFEGENFSKMVMSWLKENNY